MTLSLDDVRNKRFRMARKSGYEVLEVDEFVDEVEETFGQLFEENQNLKKQVEALRSTSAGQPAAGDRSAAGAPAATGAGSAPAAAAAPAPAGERIVVTTSKEASTAVVRLVEMSTDQAERLVAEATAEATRIREEADQSASALSAEAHGRAEKVESEARAHAERLQADAQQRAETLDRDIDERRREMFGSLQRQQEELSSTVHALRSFEATYRANLTRHLQSQIEVLSSGSEEPAEPPAGLLTPQPAAAAATAPAQPVGDGGDSAPASSGTAAGQQSETPRLDALLGDQR